MATATTTAHAPPRTRQAKEPSASAGDEEEDLFDMLM
jgi:hypothetical protein